MLNASRPERRRLPRFLLASDIDVDGTPARTIDLSGNGARFETARPFAPGDRVALVFPLTQTGPDARVTCTAHVVRVEARGSHFEVAVAYEPVAFNVALS